jgi:hypothetical protein
MYPKKFEAAAPLELISINQGPPNWFNLEVQIKSEKTEKIPRLYSCAFFKEIPRVTLRELIIIIYVCAYLTHLTIIYLFFIFAALF